MWLDAMHRADGCLALCRPTGPIDEPMPELPADIDPHDSCPLPDSLDEYNMAGDANGTRPSGNGADSKYL
jgi:hypothetical protein